MLWLTGRPERNRRATKTWLAAQGLPTEPLIMRARPGLPPGPGHQARRAAPAAGATGRSRSSSTTTPQVVELLAADGFPTRLADWLPRTAPLHNAQESDGRT